jgi:hypothetical protein
MKHAHLFMSALALACAACAKEPPPEPVIVFKSPPAPSIAAECNDGSDPQWTELPDADVKRSDGARNYAANRTAFHLLKSKRRVCSASLRAQFPLMGKD